MRDGDESYNWLLDNGEAIGKGRSVLTKLGTPEKVARSHRNFLSGLGARRAVAKIEAAIKRSREA